MSRREISSYLKKFRERSQITQGDLAEMLGISRQSVISLESGRCIPSVALAIRVSRLFEMPVEFIFRELEYDGEEKNKAPEGDGGNMSRDLMPWSPLREIMSMRETMDRFFEEPVGRTTALFHPAVGIRETDKELVIEADIPGVKEEDLDVEIENDKVIVKGERKHKEETKKEDYYHLESSYGSFSRMISLPSYVDSSKAEAEFKNGVLEIKIPKVTEKQSKKLKVKKQDDK